MAEPRRRARLDVALERRPGAVGIANAFAVAAHREQPFERHELLAQPQNSLGHVEPCDEFFVDDRLRDEIVDAGVHGFDEVAEAGADRLHPEVAVRRGRLRPDAAAQLVAAAPRYTCAAFAISVPLPLATAPASAASRSGACRTNVSIME